MMQVKNNVNKYTEYELIVKASNGGGRTICNYSGTLDELVADARVEADRVETEEMYGIIKSYVDEIIDDVEFIEQVFGYDCRSVSLRRCLSEAEIRAWLKTNGKRLQDLSVMEAALVRRDLERDDYIKMNEPISAFLFDAALVFSDAYPIPKDVKEYLESDSNWLILYDTRIWNRGV